MATINQTLSLANGRLLAEILLHLNAGRAIEPNSDVHKWVKDAVNKSAAALSQEAA